MGAGRNILLVVVSIFLVLFVFFFALLLTANSLLHPEIYTDAFEKSGVYNYLDNLKDNATAVPGGEFLIIPEGGSRVLVSDALTNFLAYLRGDADYPHITLGLNGTALRDFFEKNVAEMPVCAEGETSIGNGFGGTSDCRPAEKSVSVFLDEILAENNITLPEEGEVDLAEIYGLENENVEQIRSRIGDYYLALYGTLFFSLVLVGLLFLISKDPRKGTRITGIDFFIAGTGVIISSVAAGSLIGLIGIETEIIKDLIEEIARSLISKDMIYGIISLGIGIALFAGSFFIKEKQGKPKSEG